MKDVELTLNLLPVTFPKILLLGFTVSKLWVDGEYICDFEITAGRCVKILLSAGKHSFTISGNGTAQFEMDFRPGKCTATCKITAFGQEVTGPTYLS